MFIIIAQMLLLISWFVNYTVQGIHGEVFSFFVTCDILWVFLFFLCFISFNICSLSITVNGVKWSSGSLPSVDSNSLIDWEIGVNKRTIN